MIPKRLKHIIVLLLLCYNMSLFSQQAFSRRNHITFSFNNIQLEDNSYYYQDNLISLQLELKRSITDYFIIGGYLGFGIYEEWLYEQDNTSSSLTFLEYTNSIHYGLTSNLSVLPLLIKTKIPRFDLYLASRIGCISLLSTKAEDIIPLRGPYFDYSLMGGGSIYLSKKLGLFIEAGYKNFKYYKGFTTRYGLTFRF